MPTYLKELATYISDWIQKLSTGKIVSIHLRNKETKQTEKEIVINNSLVIFWIVVIGTIIYFLKYF